jgi:hypothetical protein
MRKDWSVGGLEGSGAFSDFGVMSVNLGFTDPVSKSSFSISLNCTLINGRLELGMQLGKRLVLIANTEEDVPILV